MATEATKYFLHPKPLVAFVFLKILVLAVIITLSHLTL